MKIIAIAALGTFCYSALSETVCVGPSATGNGTGSDWNNTAAWSSVNFVRGDIYYLQDGSYAGKSLSTATSGSTLITIKKAVASDHGTDNGWNLSTMGSGQAAISSLAISSSYWTINGQSGDGASVCPCDISTNNYGIYISDADDSVFLSGALTNITISHARFYTTRQGTYAILQGPTDSGTVNSLTISYCLFNGFNSVYANGSGIWSNVVFEYNVVLNSEGDSKHHGNVINALWAPLVNNVIRYNVFYGYTSQYGDHISGVIVANGANINGALIYGNVFDQIGGCTYLAGANSGYFINNCVFYNNTVINTPNYSGYPVCGRNSGTGNIARNNLYYDGAWDYPYGSAWPNHDYDAWYSCANGAGESHEFIITANPFMNYTGMDYRLATNTPAGQNLGSSYNTDPLGHQRTTWSRGAFEYAASGSNSNPPGITSDLKGVTNSASVEFAVNVGATRTLPLIYNWSSGGNRFKAEQRRVVPDGTD